MSHTPGPEAVSGQGLFDRFWDKVSPEPNSGCWLWTGGISKGYGAIWIDPEYKTYPAHRVSYLMHSGPIPENLVIDHLCRVKSCVNPDHMECVATGENTRRGISGLRNRQKTHCRNGHPFAGENLYVHPGGGRACRICRRKAHAKHQAARAAIKSAEGTT